MDWTIGPLDYFFNFYFGPFSLDHFIFFFLEHFIGGVTLLVLREGLDAVYQFQGRSERQTVIIQGGVEDELLVRREG